MKKILLITQFLVITLFLFANPITNVRAMQEGNKIVLFYDLNVNTYIGQITMRINDKNRVISNEFLKGDINKNIMAGSDKRIEYDVLADYVDGLKADKLFFIIESLLFNEFVAVDLGLSVKWASHNLGADKPEDIGDYFSWGELKPKSRYDWKTYKYCNGTSHSLIKYCNHSGYNIYGFIDNNIELDYADDVASVTLNRNWRMPTKDEIEELRTECKWEFMCFNGVNGYKVIGKNGNYIFLPATGYMLEGHCYKKDSYGYYWSNSLAGNSPEYACCLYFYLKPIFTSNLVAKKLVYRNYGLPIRAVYP